MKSWPLAFTLTVMIEAAVLVVLFRKNTDVWRILAAAAICNAVTHPVVWFVLPRLFSTYGAYIIASEAFAFTAEVPILLLVIRPKPWHMSIAGSALANGGSYLVGLAIHMMV